MYFDCALSMMLITNIIPSRNSGDNFSLDHGFDCSAALGFGYISPKLHELLQLFLSFG